MAHKTKINRTNSKVQTEKEGDLLMVRISIYVIMSRKIRKLTTSQWTLIVSF